MSALSIVPVRTYRLRVPFLLVFLSRTTKHCFLFNSWRSARGARLSFSWGDSSAPSSLSLSSLTLSLSLSVSLRAQRRSLSLFSSSLLLFSSLFCSHLCSLLSSSSFCVWFVESTCWGKKRTKTEAKKRDERFRHLRVLNWMPTMRILLSFFFLSACNVSEETFFCFRFFSSFFLFGV